MSDSNISYNTKISKRFRGFFPVVIDVETGGVNPEKDAVLEIAAVTLNCNDSGTFDIADDIQFHIEPFKGAKLNPKSLAINKIVPDHPFRLAISEKEALDKLFQFLKPKQLQAKCNRCVLVGHNAWFDLAFLNSAIKRSNIKESIFHAFTSLDTATLGAVHYGHTVLAQMLKLAGIDFNQDEHHSAIYDARKTAEIFCKIVNQQPWPKQGLT